MTGEELHVQKHVGIRDLGRETILVRFDEASQHPYIGARMYLLIDRELGSRRFTEIRWLNRREDYMGR